jgi:hypothetical protein
VVLRATALATFNSPRPALLPLVNQHRISDATQRFVVT